MKKMKIAATMLLLVLTVSIFAQDIPEPKGFVNDFANIIAGDIRTRIENLLASYEEKTSIEIAVVTVSSLQGYTVEQFTITLANKWGVGKKSNNGLVILVAPEERKWRIEVGYALEPYITDYEAKSIGESSFKELFKQKKYGEGIEKGILKIQERLGTASWQLREEEKKRKDEETRKRTKEIFDSVVFVTIIVIVVLVFVWGIFLFFRFLKKKEKEKIDVINARVGVAKKIEEYMKRCSDLIDLDFKKAKSVSASLANLKGAMPALKRFCDENGYEESMEKILKQAEVVEEAVRDLFNEEDCHKYVLESETKFLHIRKKVNGIMDDAKRALSFLKKDAPKAVWEKYADFANESNKVFDEGKKEILIAQELDKKHDFVKAEKKASGVIKKSSEILSLLHEICEKKKEWVEAKESGEKHFQNLSETEKEKIKDKATDDGMMNWIIALAAISSMSSSNHKSSYSSSNSSFSSSNSNSFSGFGGGGFGGGGASGSW